MYVLGTQYSNPHSCFQPFVVCVHRHTLCDCQSHYAHTGTVYGFRKPLFIAYKTLCGWRCNKYRIFKLTFL